MTEIFQYIVPLKQIGKPTTNSVILSDMFGIPIWWVSHP